MKRWLTGAGIALLLLSLITVMATTDWFGFRINDLFAADYNIYCSNDTAITESTYTTSDNLTFIYSGPGNGHCVLDEALSVGSVVVQNGVTLTHAVEDSDGVHITTTGDFSVDSGGSVNVDAQGCTAKTNNADGYGPNGSNICTQSVAGYSPSGGATSGAGHGGLGGRGRQSIRAGQVYDTPTAPVLFGSSAGDPPNGPELQGGAGGGVIWLNVGGVFTNNGTISADGGAGTYDSGGSGAGGGSGGSIYITADTVSDGGNPEGTFSADGGNGGGYPGYDYDSDGGGGGGGMIALLYDTNDGTNPFNFDAGDFSANGGISDPGYSEVTTWAADGNKGSVYVKNTTANTVNVYHGFLYDDSDYSVSSWTADSSATGQFCKGGSTSPSIAAGTISLSGVIDCDNLGVSGTFTLASSGTINLNGLRYRYLSGTGTLTSSGLTVTGTGTQFTKELAIGDFVVAAGQTRRVATISSNKTFTVDQDFVPALSGASFTSYTTSYYSDGEGTLSSSGTSVTGINTRFTRELAVGTVIKASDGISEQTRTVTAIASDTSLTTDTAFSPALTTSYQLSHYLNFNQSWFNISGSPAVTVSGSSQIYGNANWSTLASLNIGPGSTLMADRTGCSNGYTGQTDGYGPDGSNVCTISTAGYGDGTASGGGAGHGGLGGRGNTTSQLGASYDDPIAPVLFGSSGGNCVTSGQLGGIGGGAIRIAVTGTGTLTHNGLISAKGGGGDYSSPSGHGSGGGSGGSIYITAGTVSDGGSAEGTFTANGGTGSGYLANGYNDDGGGGGGGMIALTYATNDDTNPFNFDSGDFSVAGGLTDPDYTETGSLSHNGGNGSVYIKNTTTNAVSVYHGFPYSDTDYSATSWTVDSSATGQFCKTGSTSPSITAPTLSLSGTIECDVLGDSGTFTLSSSGTVTLSGLTYRYLTGPGTVSSSGTTVTGTGTFFSQEIQVGDFLVASGQTQQVITVTSNNSLTVQQAFNPSLSSASYVFLTPNRSNFNITGGPAVTVSGSSKFFGNATWSTLASLNLGAGSLLDATYSGCYSNTTSYANGFGPTDPGNVCTQSTTGYGIGANSGAGGAGHGGAGGRGNGNSQVGATYDSPTAPALYGSSGGNSGSVFGGIGGGLVTISATGSVTLNGSISANGGVGGDNPSGSAGGGSGGSIYLTTGSISGSGSFTANGGNGADYGSSNENDGGGGGGGRVYYEYAGGSFGGSCTVNGGDASPLGGSSSAVDGSVGTCDYLLTDDPPGFTTISHNPTSPSATDPVTISATATDDNGINQMKIYVDSGSGYVLKKTCTFSASSPATCSTSGEIFARGSHTVKVEATDTVATTTTNTSHTFSVAAQTTSNLVVLGREKINTATIFAVDFDLAGSSTGTLTVTFPSGFVLGNFATTVPSGSCVGGTVSSFNRVSDTVFTAAKSGCGAGTVSVSNVPITTPSSPGEYIITWTNDNGQGVLYVIDDDTVMINAAIDATLTFDLDVATSDVQSAQPYNLNLGTLLTTQVSGSEDSAIPGIWVDISTNATGGALITVSSANAALKSASVSGDTIPSGAVSIGAEGYGLCVSSGGLGQPTQTGGALTKVSPFNDTCTTSSWTVGTLTTGAQTIFNTGGNPIDAGRAQIRTAASISSLTEAHNDYTDTLTFIATGTF